jgi:hypothetical protein
LGLGLSEGLGLAGWRLLMMKLIGDAAA